jgi:hypothetical protein
MNLEAKDLRNFSLLSEKIINKIESYCPCGKLDLATFEKFCSISFDDDVRIYAERRALMAEVVALKIGLTEKTKAAFFAGLLYHDVGGRILPYNLFNGRDENAEKCTRVKSCIIRLFDKCENGNIFVAYCVGLQHELQKMNYGITSWDFPPSFSLQIVEKYLEYIKIIEAIVNICDEKIRSTVLRKGVACLE